MAAASSFRAEVASRLAPCTQGNTVQEITAGNFLIHAEFLVTVRFAHFRPRN